MQSLCLPINSFPRCFSCNQLEALLRELYLPENSTGLGVGRDDATEAAGGNGNGGNSSGTVISKPEPSKAIF